MSVQGRCDGLFLAISKAGMSKTCLKHAEQVLLIYFLMTSWVRNGTVIPTRWQYFFRTHARGLRAQQPTVLYRAVSPSDLFSKVIKNLSKTPCFPSKTLVGNRITIFLWTVSVFWNRQHIMFATRTASKPVMSFEEAMNRALSKNKPVSSLLNG